MMEGIFNIPFEQYQGIDAISKHGLDSLAISPLHHWKWCRDPNRVNPKDTPAKIIGNAIHTAILEPERFQAEFMEEPQPPEGSLITLPDYQAECKKRELKVSGTKPVLMDRLIMAGLPLDAFWDHQYDQLTKGKKVLSTPDWRTTKAIAARVKRHPEASELLKNGKAEQSIVWIDQDTGVKCKGRIDWIAIGSVSSILLDLKSTNDASPIGFQRSIAKYKYYIQAAMYLDGMAALGFEQDAFIFAAWEKHSPYAPALYYASESLISAGRTEYKKLLKIYRNCLETDKWEGYPSGIHEVSLPANFQLSPESELESNWLDEMTEG